MSYELILSLIAAVIAGAWHFGSSGPEKRENFKGWLASCRNAAKPRVAKAASLLLKLLFPALCFGSAAIAWSAANDIYLFLISSEPILRAEVFNLILHVFNTLSYLLISTTFLALSFKIPTRGFSPEQQETGHQFRLTANGSLTSKEWTNLVKQGINVRVVILGKGQIALHVDSEGIIIESVTSTA